MQFGKTVRGILALILCVGGTAMMACASETLVESGESDENVGEAEQEYIGQPCNVRNGPNGGCSGLIPGTCCVTNPGTGAGVCRDLNNDDSNCGECGNECSGMNDYCYQGDCVI